MKLSISKKTRWVIAVAVLVAALVVAVWPRSTDTDPVASPSANPSGTSSATTEPSQDLYLARNKAALRPCPQRDGGPRRLQDINLTCLGDGEKINVARASSGRTLINLWATWCQPCHAELKVLDEYAISPGAIPVLAIQVMSKQADGLELLTKLGVHLPAAIDETDASQRALAAPPTLPASFLVEPDGSFRLITNPTVFISVDQVRSAVG